VSVFEPWLCGLNVTPTVHDAPLVSVLPAEQVDDEIARSVPVSSAAELIRQDARDVERPEAEGSGE